MSPWAMDLRLFLSYSPKPDRINSSTGSIMNKTSISFFLKTSRCGEFSTAPREVPVM